MDDDELIKDDFFDEEEDVSNDETQEDTSQPEITSAEVSTTTPVNDNVENTTDYSSEVSDTENTDDSERTGETYTIETNTDAGTEGETYSDTVKDEVPEESPRQTKNVTVTMDEAITNFSAAYLQQLEDSGAIPVAVLNDGTEIECEWSDVFDPNIATSQGVLNEAKIIADAINQHFWTDDNGAHVTNETRDVWEAAAETNFSDQSDTSLHNNLLMNSFGMLIRSKLFNLASLSKSALAFYDGEANGMENINAFFGSQTRIGKYLNKHIDISDSGISFYDYTRPLMRINAEKIFVGELPGSEGPPPTQHGMILVSQVEKTKVYSQGDVLINLENVDLSLINSSALNRLYVTHRLDSLSGTTYFYNGIDYELDYSTQKIIALRDLYIQRSDGQPYTNVVYEDIGPIPRTDPRPYTYNPHIDFYDKNGRVITYMGSDVVRIGYKNEYHADLRSSGFRLMYGQDRLIETTHDGTTASIYVGASDGVASLDRYITIRDQTDSDNPYRLNALYAYSEPESSLETHKLYLATTPTTSCGTLVEYTYSENVRFFEWFSTDDTFEYGWGMSRDSSELAEAVSSLGMTAESFDSDSNYTYFWFDRPYAPWGNGDGTTPQQISYDNAFEVENGSLLSPTEEIPDSGFNLKSNAEETSMSVGANWLRIADTSLVIGKHNLEYGHDDYALLVGNGTSDTERSNALAVTWDGHIHAGRYCRLGVDAIDVAPESSVWYGGFEWYIGDDVATSNRAAILELGHRPTERTLRLTLSGGSGGTGIQSGLIINKSYGNTYNDNLIFNADNGELTVPNSITSYGMEIMSPSATSNYAGFIDFHYNQTTDNYTERIMGTNGGFRFRSANTGMVLEAMSDTVNAASPTNGITSAKYPGLSMVDGSGRIMSRFECVLGTDGSKKAYWYVRQYAEGGTTQTAQKGISMKIPWGSTAVTYTVDDPANFRSAIGALSTGGGTISGANLNLKSTNINRDAANPSSATGCNSALILCDADNERIAGIDARRETDGRIGCTVWAANDKSSGGSTVYNTINMFVNRAGTATYSVTNAANFRSAIGAAASSDRRLKSDIQELDDDAVEFVKSLKPSVYTINGERQLGLIAQDVHKADQWGTRMAFETEDGLDGLDDWERMEDGSPTWKLDYIRLLPPTIKALQKAMDRIDALELCVAELGGRS